MQSTFQEGRFNQVKITRFGYESRLLVAYDVTHIRKLEQMRKDFVDNISHELRTPLTVISGFLEHAQDEPNMPMDERVKQIDFRFVLHLCNETQSLRSMSDLRFQK